MTTVTYHAEGKSNEGYRITGTVELNSQPEVSSNIVYDILSFRFFCKELVYDSAGQKSHLIQFNAGPYGLISTSNAVWRMGQWNNGGGDGTGVWFKRVDGITYSAPNPPVTASASNPLVAEGDGAYGRIEDYRYLPPWIELCADLVSGGPFTPTGRIRLRWSASLIPPSDLKVS